MSWALLKKPTHDLLSATSPLQVVLIYVGGVAEDGALSNWLSVEAKTANGMRFCGKAHV